MARTGQVTYASAGTGGPAHLAGALLAHSTGTQMKHVPFKGAAPAIAEVMSGRVSATFYTMSGLKEYVAAKRVKPLAITARQRHPDFPTVPTMTEAGVPGFDNVGAWFGIVAPAGTPADVVARLNSAIDRSLAKPEVRDRLVGPDQGCGHQDRIRHPLAWATTACAVARSPLSFTRYRGQP